MIVHRHSESQKSFTDTRVPNPWAPPPPHIHLSSSLSLPPAPSHASPSTLSLYGHRACSSNHVYSSLVGYPSSCRGDFVLVVMAARAYGKVFEVYESKGTVLRYLDLAYGVEVLHLPWVVWYLDFDVWVVVQLLNDTFHEKRPRGHVFAFGFSPVRD